MKIIPILLTGAAVVTAAVIALHLPHDNSEPEEVFVPAATVAERMNYFSSHGWETEEISEKNITIPSVFSDEYEEYARIQDKQGLPLRRFAGRNGQLYVYEIRNYSPESRRMLAELLVCDDIAVGSIVYSDDGESVRMPVQ